MEVVPFIRDRDQVVTDRVLPRLDETDAESVSFGIQILRRHLVREIEPADETRLSLMIGW
jgi:hypothetical protein